MRAIFLADAHLRHPDDPNYKSLLDFLDRQQERIDALFLLGDIFEFWIGYQHLVFAEHIPLLSRLQHLAENGCHLYYVEGNHDFHLGGFFTKTLNCTVISDQQIIELGEKKVFICHGDLANTKARAYRLMRAFWRSSFLKLIAALVPADATWRFGNFLCALSRKKKRYLRDPSPLILPYAKSSLLQGADCFVCGHFHYPIQTETDEGTVIVLGDWIEQLSYLEFTDGIFTLKSFQS